MKRFDRLVADEQALLITQCSELERVLVAHPTRDIGGHEHAPCGGEARRRIEDVLIEPVGPGEPAIDIAVGFPEARAFESDLDALEILNVLQRRFLRRREVAWNALE